MQVVRVVCALSIKRWPTEASGAPPALRRDGSIDRLKDTKRSMHSSGSIISFFMPAYKLIPHFSTSREQWIMMRLVGSALLDQPSI